MRVVMLSTDRTILIPGSQAAERMRAYGTGLTALDILLAGTGAEAHVRLSETVTVHYPGGGSKVVNFFRLLYLARTLPADVISAQDPVWTGLIALVSRKRVVQVQVHTDTWGVLGTCIARYVLRRATCVRVVSQRVREKVATYTQAPVSVLPIFVDVAPYLQVSEPPIEYGHGPRILVVARLAPEKRVDRVLQALTEVPGAHLYIVGDGPLRRPLELLAERLGLTHRVHFLGWKTNVVPYYQHADCFVLTSAFEGYGMALLEASLAGCPVVSTHVGIAPELPKEIVTLTTGAKYDLARALRNALAPERADAARSGAEHLRKTRGDYATYLSEYQRLLRQCGV